MQFSLSDFILISVSVNVLKFKTLKFIVSGSLNVKRKLGLTSIRRVLLNRVLLDHPTCSWFFSGLAQLLHFLSGNYQGWIFCEHSISMFHKWKGPIYGFEHFCQNESFLSNVIFFCNSHNLGKLRFQVIVQIYYRCMQIYF